MRPLPKSNIHNVYYTCTRARCIPQEDWLGLRSLDEQGKLLFEEAPGAHMQFTLDWFKVGMGLGVGCRQASRWSLGFVLRANYELLHGGLCLCCS